MLLSLCTLESLHKNMIITLEEIEGIDSILALLLILA